eukprot:COSAG04_NODE_116_length_25104_cov_94.064907_16_plen_241_part_01
MEPLHYTVPVDERGGFTIEVLQPPLPPPLVDELLELWSHAEIFGHAPDDGEGGVRAVLSGHEADDNRDVLYVARVDGALAGSTKLCVSTGPHPWFGGLGEVSTLPEFRRRGIAEALCTRAREDFISVGGKMLVLGTVNPLAARRYFAIGYRRMPGAHDRLLACFLGVTPMPRRRRRHQLLVEQLRGRSQRGGVGDGPLPRRPGGAAVGERGDSRSAHPDDLADLLPERPGRARRQHPSAPA